MSLRPDLGLGLSGNGSAYSPEATALFARFTTPPTVARRAAINTMIVALKTAGVWAKLDWLHVYAAADSQAARQNWVQNAYNGTAVNSPTFTADRGYISDGSSSYLNTGFDPSSATTPQWAQNSAHMMVYSRTDANNGNYFDMGIVTGTVTRSLNAKSTVVNSLRGAGPNSATLSNFGTTQTNSLGMFTTTRVDGATETGYQNATQRGAVSAASAAVGAGTMCTLALAASSVFSLRQLGAASAGAGLSPTDMTNLYNAVQAYMTTVGANV